MNGKYQLGLILVVLASLVAPLLVSNFALTLVTEILITAIFVSGVNLLMGFTGLVPLGNAMFLGLGAYSFAVFIKLLGWPLWIAFPAALIVIAAVAAVIGVVCTRTRDVEFLLITLAFCQLFYGAAIKVSATGGSDGMTGIPRADLALLSLDASSVAGFYFYVFAISLFMIVLLWKVVHSPFGSVLVGIRENEKRLIAMSYNVAHYKVGAFVIAALFAGVAGVLTAQYTYFINPEMMTWEIGGEAVLMAIIGGRRYLLGGLVGAAVFVLVKHQLSLLTDDYLIFFGIFFMLCVVFFKDGFIGAATRFFTKMRI
jgi:branched-chain amino acid transport system permease protein